MLRAQRFPLLLGREILGTTRFLVQRFGVRIGATRLVHLFPRGTFGERIGVKRFFHWSLRARFVESRFPSCIFRGRVSAKRGPVVCPRFAASVKRYLTRVDLPEQRRERRLGREENQGRT